MVDPEFRVSRKSRYIDKFGWVRKTKQSKSAKYTELKGILGQISLLT